MKFPLLLAATVAYVYAVPTYKECNPDATTCEFWLEVKEQLTMIQQIGRPTLIYATKGRLYRFDEHPSNFTTFVPPSTVITADGVHRMVIAINGTLPGPPLVVYEGQQLIIHTKNGLLSDSLTMHWHGMYQRGTNVMDGVVYITQCPILPGQTFTYKFKAEPKGTHWYHSHVGAQRTNGIAGALIVKERPKGNKVYPKEYIMTVGEWEHESTETSRTKMTQGNFDEEGRSTHPTKAVDGGSFSPIPWVSGLIDGKGRYTNPHTGKSTETPCAQYDVKRGEEYRFRVIHTGAQYPMRISVDNHDLVVIATDGHEIQHQRVESFILNAGERFDFILRANQHLSNYWIRAVSLEVNVPNHSVEAILHYDGAPAWMDPTTVRRVCSAARKCKVLNCLWNLYPSKENIQCILIGDLKDSENTPAPGWVDGSEEHFLNFNIAFTRRGPKSNVNGKVFDSPMVASASQDNEIDPAKDCSRRGCGKNKMCACNHELRVPFGKIIQMVWINMGAGAHGSHPIHLHGHSFYLLKTVFPEQDPVTGLRVKATELVHPDVDCRGDMYCNQATWKNPAWNNGNVPGLNLNPTRKDSVIVPNGGYVVLRIKSDNPGKWFMHCHIEVHAIEGMALTLAEAIDRLAPPPKGFPLCNNFYADPEKDLYRSNKEGKGNSCQRRDTVADILKDIFL